MLRELSVTDFKSIHDAHIRLGDFNVFLGPNAAGKSNVLDAIQCLSRLASERTVQDALGGPVRGNPVELFRFPSGGFKELLSLGHAGLRLGALVDRFDRTGQPFKYSVEIGIDPGSGTLEVKDEYLATLQKRTYAIKGTPRIRKEENHLIIPSGSGRPTKELLHQNHTKLSDLRYGGLQYLAIDQCRRELSGWRVYYLDPRDTMRASTAPRLVNDIGMQGENIQPFIYRLRREKPDLYTVFKNVVTAIIPGISGFDIDLDENRGLLEASVVQNGIDFSLRVVSEGTLRVMGICAAIINPWGGGVIAIEEPENGIQPQRIEIMARLLLTKAGPRNQIIVSTHSPLFCSSAFSQTRDNQKCDARFFAVSYSSAGTKITPIDFGGPLFAANQATELLKNKEEEYVVQQTITRQLFDA